jgi:tRNA/tmRNA/rRNA uracil-C5-methylase (TrmA/RlmC/RlmD family)
MEVAHIIFIIRMSYEEQLATKWKMMKECMDKFAKNLNRLKKDKDMTPDKRQQLDWVMERLKDGMICPIDAVIPSVSTERYRNKSEFSIGIGSDGLPTVGFMLGLYKDGINTVMVDIILLILNRKQRIVFMYTRLPTKLPHIVKSLSENLLFQFMIECLKKAFGDYCKFELTILEKVTIKAIDF